MRCAAPGRTGFTIVELMVSLAIIAVLMSLLAPGLGRVRETARRTVCMTNLRTFGQALQMYRDDHEGALPYAVHFVDVTFEVVDRIHPLDALVAYMDGVEVPHVDAMGQVVTAAPFLCPSDTDFGDQTGFSYMYMPSIFMAGYLFETHDKLKAAKSATVHLFDVAPYRQWVLADYGGWHAQSGPDQNSKRNVLRFDGSIGPGATSDIDM